jgi:predicted Rossmann-fold nucleotide-binding protein
MNQARNAIVVASADAVIALPGEAGTLSEIGLALKIGRPVVALGAWRHIAGVRHAENPQAAVTLAFKLAGIALPAENRND